ncbi:MAG TPA: gas vesicle protein K [Vicinamibacterales bacterium]|nr:gas vesicle protein K [Vicinamibacterales bacterium]
MRTTTAAAVGKQRTVARHRGARPAQGGAAPLRWNPPAEDVQRSVAQLVLTIVEFLRRLMERQAIRRMEQRTLTRKEVEAVGDALMKLEETVREIGAKFGLTAEDLNLDLGPLGKLM